MEDLFLHSYPAHFGLSAASTTHFTLTTNAAYFEVEDDANRELVLHTTQGMGMARFTNPGQLAVTIVNYDKFLTSLPPKFQEGRKRCDLILCSELDRYFILGELKDRVYHKKNRSKAKKQLIASLQTILEVAELNSLAASKAERMCCYFNKQSEAPAILSVTTAFNRLSALHPDGFRMESLPIEALGFAFYEYTGTQTAHLLASPAVAVLPAP